MTDTDTVVLFIVGVMVLEGIWLIGLTYMMWRKHQLEKKRKAETEQPGTSK